MADSVQRSFEGMTLNRPPAQQSQHQSQQHLGLHSPLNGTLSSNASSSLRSPSGTYGSAQLPGQTTNDGQSAAARFERFFNTSGNQSPQALDAPAHSLGGFPPSPHQPASLGPGSAFGSFGHNFNSGIGSAFMGNNSTVPALRSKPSNTRQGLPSQWNSLTSDDLSAGSSPPSQFNSGGPGSFFTAGSGSTAYPGVSNTTSTAALGLGDDDIIPTAIVVKNIPFSVKREQLLQIIEELNIPMPYAFNYHFDQGVFRGLAFANFRSGGEADAVVAALNGFDVSGRKLRVEYKKVLQAGEKERIEKEKAIKRMQSMQMEKERVRRQTVSSATGEEWNPQFGQQSTGTIGRSSMAPGSELETGYSDAYNEAIAPISPDLVRSTSDSQSELAAGAASEVAGKKDELDLNDPATLEIYSRVLLFKDDRMRDELSFSKNLTTNERRIVHMVSKKLNLYHYSLGEGDERYVIVTKNEVNQPQRPLRSQASTIGRNHRIGEGGGAMTGANGLLAPGSSYTMGRNALRTKKSAPDMKRQRERSDDGSFGVGGSYGFVSGSTSNGGSAHSAFGPAGLSRKSNGNLREGYSSSVGRRSVPSSGTGGAANLQSLFSSPFDVPPVPSLPTSIGGEPISYSPSPSPIGTSSTSNNGSFSAATSQNILRQPAGPGAANRNFAQRSRVPIGGLMNGHGAGQDGSGNSIPNGSSDFDGQFNAGGPGELREDDVQTHQPLEV
ncbi:hypothetical protein L7F22_003184 [Adiantum nelumboides]|nr:hypothetical protein [Adiantum nelumboides]